MKNFKKFIIVSFIFIFSYYKSLGASEAPTTACITCGKTIFSCLVDNTTQIATIKILDPMPPSSWNNVADQSRNYEGLMRDKKEYAQCGLPLHPNSELYLKAHIYLNNQPVTISDSSDAFDAYHFFSDPIHRDHKKTELPITLHKQHYQAQLIWPENFDAKAEKVWTISNYPHTQSPSPLLQKESHQNASSEIINRDKQQKYILFMLLISSWAWFLYKTYQKN